MEVDDGVRLEVVVVVVGGGGGLCCCKNGERGGADA